MPNKSTGVQLCIVTLFVLRSVCRYALRAVSQKIYHGGRKEKSIKIKRLKIEKNHLRLIQLLQFIRPYFCFLSFPFKLFLFLSPCLRGECL
jgi:hypothetical protein